MTATQIAAIARRQLEDYDAHRPGRVFENVDLVLTVGEAYEVQRQMAVLRAIRGEPVAGYKIGCVSEVVQRQLGIAGPVFGQLFATEMYQSDVVLDSAAFEGLAIEGEIAVRLAEDIPSVGRLREHPERAIASVFLVIELHNKMFRRAAPTAEELIANNAFHAGVVRAPFEIPWLDAAKLDDEPIAVIRNGVLLGMTTYREIPGGPLASVAKVAEHLGNLDVMLRRDQIVLTGSPLPLYPAGPGDRIEVHGPRSSIVGLTVTPGAPG